MEYLSNTDIEEISNVVKLVSINDVDEKLFCDFDSGIKEYNDFLEEAKSFDVMNISKTHVLIHNTTNEIIGYMTLSTDSIKLSNDEKNNDHLSSVPFAAIPATKVGKLAVNKKLSEISKRKGYGSFLLEMARACVFQLNEDGIASRFITVDADIEYNQETVDFYIKNGFVENLKYKKKKSDMVSMRIDIFNQEQIEELQLASSN